MEVLSNPVYWVPMLILAVGFMIWGFSVQVFLSNRKKLKPFIALVEGRTVNFWGRAIVTGMWRGKQVEITYGLFLAPQQLRVNFRQVFPLTLEIRFKGGSGRLGGGGLKKIAIGCPEFEKKYALAADDPTSARTFLNEKKQKIIDVLMFDSLRFDREGLRYLDYLDHERDLKPERAQILMARLGELTF